MDELSFQPVWTAPGAPFRHTWREIGNIDQFRWLPRADVLRQLTLARDELGVRHVRAVAMYSPALAAWDFPLPQWQRPPAEKVRQANWQLVDLSLEALLESGLKPVYTTCFTPEGMSDDPVCCWPDRNPTGMPRDLGQWTDFVREGVRHHLIRYGRAEVRSWLFECWNEPNLRGFFFGGDRDDFFRLWSATWRAVKAADPELRLGGPSTARAEWIEDFLEFTRRDGTPPDYLITHVYNNDADAQPLAPFDGPASHRVKDSPHFAAGMVRGLRRRLRELGWTGVVHWNEWGRSWFLHDPRRETPLEAAFIVKTMAEVSQDADQFAYWCLSDIYHQGGLASEEFQGVYGMLSLHGLRKPAWFAHLLLNRLGTRRWAADGGDETTGVIATRHPSGSGAVLGYAYPATPLDPPTTAGVSVLLPPGADRVRLTRLGAVENNVTAAWRALGAPAYPSPEEMAELHAANHLTPAPAGALRLIPGPDGLRASFALERPGVALLEFA